MALNDVTISLDLNQLLGGDIDTRRTRVYVKTNVTNGTLIDTSTGETRLGDERVTLEADGTGSFTTWGVNGDGNPTSWQTSVVVEYPRAGSRDRVTRTFGPYTITDADNGKTLAELEDQQAIPPNYQSAFVADMEVIRDEAEAARDAAVDISNIDTSDGVVSTLIEGTAGAGPLTRSALSASLGEQIETPSSPANLAAQALVEEGAAALDADLIGSRIGLDRNVYALGDSTSVEQLGFDASIGNTRSSLVQFQPKVWQMWALFKSGYRWTHAGTYAVAGYTSSQIMPLLTQLIADKPAGGTIVIAAGHNGHNLADTIALHETARAAGFRTVAVATPPHSVAGLSTVAAFNQGIKAYALANGIPLADVHSALVDPATGAYQAGYDSGDGIHPNAEGYRVMGETIATVLNGLWSTALSGVKHNAAITGQYKINPLALTTPFVTTGTEPHFVFLVSPGTTTCVQGTNPDFYGGKSYKFTRGDTNVEAHMRNNALTAGDRIRMFFAITAAPAGGGGWGFRLETTPGGNKQIFGIGYPTTITQAVVAAKFYVEFTVPESLTWRMPRIFASGVGTELEMGELDFLNLTAMGLS